MQDLAMIVTLMLVGEILVSLATVAFALIYRLTGKFRRTAMAMLAVLAIAGGWLVGLQWQIGMPAVVAMLFSIVFMYFPGRRK